MGLSEKEELDLFMVSTPVSNLFSTEQYIQ